MGEREIQLRKLKNSVLESCGRCTDFNNAEGTQEKLATLRDFYDPLRQAGIFPGSKKDWIEKYNALIKLCQKCTENLRDPQHCSERKDATELRSNI